MKGKRIYLVYISGTLFEGAMAFENYENALQYAENKFDEFKLVIDVEDIDEDLSEEIMEQEDVKEGNEPITKTPFSASIHADNREEDYIFVEVIKEIIH